VCLRAPAARCLIAPIAGAITSRGDGGFADSASGAAGPPGGAAAPSGVCVFGAAAPRAGAAEPAVTGAAAAWSAAATGVSTPAMRPAVRAADACAVTGALAAAAAAGDTSPWAPGAGEPAARSGPPGSWVTVGSRGLPGPATGGPTDAGIAGTGTADTVGPGCVEGVGDAVTGGSGDSGPAVRPFAGCSRSSRASARAVAALPRPSVSGKPDMPNRDPGGCCCTMRCAAALPTSAALARGRATLGPRLPILGSAWRRRSAGRLSRSCSGMAEAQ
jgi:hypothetical protein